MSINFINLNKFHRSSLSQSQRLFFLQLIPVTTWIQEQTVLKCRARVPQGKTKYGVFASIIAAHCILKSIWGSHPLAQDRFYQDSDTWVHGNNLWLKESGQNWKRDVMEMDGKIYRSYSDWGVFATDISDCMGWQDDYADVLAASRLPDQLNLMSLRDDNPEHYRARVSELINRYGLWEFDYRG